AATAHNLCPDAARLGSLRQARFDHTGPPAANRTGIGKPHLPGRSTWVLMDREQAGYPAALHILRSNEVAGSFGSNHEYVNSRRRHDLPKMNIKAVAKREIRSLLQIRSDVLSIDG